MRYLVGFVFVLALVSAPLAVSAQAGEEGATSEPPAEEPSPEPAPEAPALQLELDDDSVKLAPSPPPTVNGYTLEETELRVRRAKIGIGSSALAFFVGGILVASGLGGDCSWGGGAERERCDRLAYAGTALAAGGAVGMIATGILLGKRKQKLRRLQQAHYGRPSRVQWDLARSQVVF